MPIDWKLGENQLVLATAEGVVTLADLQACMDAILVGGGLGFKKLFDFSGAVLRLSDSDLMALAARVRAYASVGALGRLALVAADDETRSTLRGFLYLTAGERDARLFHSLRDAQRWLVVLPDQVGSN